MTRTTPAQRTRWWCARSTAPIAIALLCAGAGAPLVWALVTSLQPIERVHQGPTVMVPEHPQWNNYPEAARRLPLARFLLNSMVIAVASCAGAVLTSSMAGYALARRRFRGRRALMGALILSLAVPSQLLLVPRYLLIDLLGWMDTYKPLIVPAWLGGGAFNVLLFRQFFRGSPMEMEDAARLDGAGEWRVFWNIVLPSARPAIITAGLLSFVCHWREILDPLLYLSDIDTYPVSLGLRMYQTTAGAWTNLMMAASLISMVPVAVLFLACEGHVARSLGVVAGKEPAAES